MWWRLFRLGRIEDNMGQMQQSIQQLVEISAATNQRIAHFVEEMRENNRQQQARTEQLQRSTEQLQCTVEYLLSKNG